MGIELELAVLLALSVIGQSAFAPFEIETPVWRKILKWTILVVATLALTAWIGHWALILPVTGGLAGVIVHTHWCRKHGIDPLSATPRRRYYELRGWQWRD